MFQRIPLAVAIAATVVLAACGKDPFECKETAHKVAVQFELKSKFDVGTPNPEIDAAKAQAVTKWESEVKTKLGPEWATWTNTRRKSQGCGAPEGSKKWTCEAEAPPCKKR